MGAPSLGAGYSRKPSHPGIGNRFSTKGPAAGSDEARPLSVRLDRGAVESPANLLAGWPENETIRTKNVLAGGLYSVSALGLTRASEARSALTSGTYRRIAPEKA